MGHILKTQKLRIQNPKPETLHDIGEFGLIKRIARRSKRRDAAVMVGIGDDAAVIGAKANRGAPLLVTTDSLVEDIHFRRHYPPEALGWKALSVNISDIAAMGGVPRYYLLSLSIPGRLKLEYIDLFCRGMADAAKRYGLSLIGGDTTSSPDKIYISITVLGHASKNVLLRNGAKPGDAVFVTGTLGDSAIGLRILEEAGSRVRGRESDDRGDRSEKLIERHLRPNPRVKEGVMLAKSGMVTSMIDISDGLLADLGHICEESMVGASIRVDRIPLSTAFKAVSEKYDGLGLALSGGEDYELLFTVGSDAVGMFLNYAKGIKCTRIGDVVKGKGVEVLGRNGTRYPTEIRGFEHFKG